MGAASSTTDKSSVRGQSWFAGKKWLAIAIAVASVALVLTSVFVVTPYLRNRRFYARYGGGEVMSVDAATRESVRQVVSSVSYEDVLMGPDDGLVADLNTRVYNLERVAAVCFRGLQLQGGDSIALSEDGTAVAQVSYSYACALGDNYREAATSMDAEAQAYVDAARKDVSTAHVQTGRGTVKLVHGKGDGWVLSDVQSLWDVIGAETGFNALCNQCATCFGIDDYDSLPENDSKKLLGPGAYDHLQVDNAQYPPEDGATYSWDDSLAYQWLESPSYDFDEAY